MSASSNLLNEKVEMIKQKVECDGCESTANILNFIIDNPIQERYTIAEIKEASKTEDLNELMDSITFLSSKNIQLFSSRFLYFPLDNSEAIEISSKEYFEGVMRDIPPAGISEFKRGRLGFDFSIHSNLIA